MRRLLLVAIVLLVGCNLPTQTTSTPGGTVTPAPVPADAGMAPGVTTGGVVHPDVLGFAHAAVIENRTYTLESEHTVRSSDGTIRSLVDVTVRVGRDGAYRTTVSTAGDDGPRLLGSPPASGDFWSNGSDYLAAVTYDGNTTYNRYFPRGGYAGTQVYWIETVALGGSPSSDIAETFTPFATRIVDTSGESIHVRGSNTRSAGFVDDDLRNVSGATLHATLMPSGLVRSYRLSYNATAPDGTRVHVTHRVAYREVGSTTVPWPAWADRVQ